MVRPRRARRLSHNAQPVASLGELITKWLTDIGHVEGPASDLFEQLKHWYKDHYDEKTLSGYSSGPSHFGHQLRALSELPGWSKRIFKSDRRVGEHRWRQTVWKIALGEGGG